MPSVAAAAAVAADVTVVATVVVDVSFVVANRKGIVGLRLSDTSGEDVHDAALLEWGNGGDVCDSVVELRRHIASPDGNLIQPYV